MERLARHPVRDTAVDWALAAVAFAITLGVLSSGGSGDRSLDAAGVALAAFASLPLVLRRRAPLAVFAATAAGSTALNALGYTPGPPVGATVALYTVSVASAEGAVPRRAAGATVAALLAAHLVAFTIGQDRAPTTEVLFALVVWGGAWIAGDRTHLRRERMAELEQRARRAERDAERDRALAVAEERTRIARDLHDSAGHAINVILVQAGAARLLHERDPERSRAAIGTIEEVARETIGEIDRLVRALREDAAGADPSPPPGLAALDGLTARHREAGLELAVAVAGAGDVPPAVDQAAFRILQEALTNAARHGAGRADVDVRLGARAVELTVTNPAAGAAPRGDGQGLVGMRERATLLGGELSAGRHDGAFVVRARLPYGTVR